jgi:ubiquinone/menaquinone biosynthesis C-methylase UbiE
MPVATDASHIRRLRIFVSSPNDAKAEREALDEIVETINRTNGEQQSFVLQLFKWEKDVIPQIDQTPQEVIDQQTPDCDIYLGILRTRFGTPTGTYGSGTEQEFRAALAQFSTSGRPWVSFYFYSGPVQLRRAEERDQYDKVCDFREELERKGIVGRYGKVRGKRDSFGQQVRDHLITLADKLIRHPGKAEELKKEVTDGKPPPCPVNMIHDPARLALDLMGPSYTLDSNYYFLDWNPAFDALVAKPLGLARADHSVDFIKRLENCDEVIERSKIVFAGGKDPLADTEDLLFRSPAYGLTKFRKIAALVSDEKGNPSSWSVNLNIASAEQDATLWQDLEKRLQDAVNWSRYAASYDRLLTPFTDYNELVSLLVSLVGDAVVCADLGAGTGNGTLKLLQTSPDRQVWAVDSNEMMLQCLKQKVSCSDSARVFAVKDDIVRLGALRDQNDYFDAALIMNVLYAVQDPLACLCQAYRILKPGGVLALSTPHRDTDVNKLLTKLRTVLQGRGVFSSLAEEFETVRLVHEKMDHLIHRDTKADIRAYLENAGFEIKAWRDGEYVDSVVVVTAVKPLL